MNGWRRVKTAFEHREADRVPVSELYINSPVASQVLGREALTGWSGKVRCEIMSRMLIDGRADEFYMREAEDLVDLYDKLDLDTIMIERPPAARPIIPTRIDDCTFRYEDRENGLFHILHSDASSDNFHIADSNFHRGGIEEFRRFVGLLERDPVDLANYNWSQAEYITSRCRGRKYMMAVVEIDFPPMSMGALGGIFLEALAFAPELCERYLDYRVRKGLKFIDHFAAMGVDCIFDGEDLAGNQGALFSPDCYRGMYMPRFLELSRVCRRHGMRYLRHTDGNIMRFADDFLLSSGFDGYQSIDPSAGMDRALIKERYGDRVTLMGNVDCGRALHLGTREDVKRETLDVLRTLSPGGGHILSSSNTIHSHVPYENFMTMLEVAHRYGTYPIDAACE